MYALNSFATILQRSIGVDHSSYQPVPTGGLGLGYAFVVSVNTTALQGYHHYDPHLLGGRVGIWRDHVTCLRPHSWGGGSWYLPQVGLILKPMLFTLWKGLKCLFYNLADFKRYLIILSF